MVKVLIYGSKEIYDDAPFDGRAEADIIAYRNGAAYTILKNRTSQYMAKDVVHFTMGRILEWVERDEWKRDLEKHKLTESYKDHPYTTLMKNEPDV
jgi:hypothetical protein